MSRSWSPVVLLASPGHRVTRVIAVALALALAPLAAAAQTNASGIAGPAIGYAAALLAHGDLLFVGRTAVVAGFPMPSAAPGAVYVYRRSGSEWVELAVLRAQEGTVGDGFGSAITYDGTLLAIGAPDDAKRKGAVYIFARSGGTSWRQLVRLFVPDAAEGDRFGASVALQGNTALFGAPGRESGKGAVWVARSGTRGWALAEMLAPADRDSAGAFGRAVVL
ncbi:MAG: FG-GAP repeat protein, partial [Gemmatimonadales bacterium]